MISSSENTKVDDPMSSSSTQGPQQHILEESSRTHQIFAVRVRSTDRKQPLKGARDRNIYSKGSLSPLASSYSSTGHILQPEFRVMAEISRWAPITFEEKPPVRTVCLSASKNGWTLLRFIVGFDWRRLFDWKKTYCRSPFYMYFFRCWSFIRFVCSLRSSYAHIWAWIYCSSV